VTVSITKVRRLSLTRHPQLSVIAPGGAERIRWADPFFEINDRLLVYLKYTKGRRSPWGFTLTLDECNALAKAAKTTMVVVGFVCGGDGIAVLAFDELRDVAFQAHGASHIACYRKHDEHYAISGPLGYLQRKVAPSDWSRVLQKFA
jgi:hypothetical protein